MKGINEIPSLVQRLYALVAEFEELFPGRRFTPDGHLVGSIGEVLAAFYYDLELLPNSTPVHDAVTGNGQLVQIKATQRRSVGVKAVKTPIHRRQRKKVLKEGV